MKQIYPEIALQSSTVLREDRESLLILYDVHSPKLWGLILKANLAQSQSEAILLNSFVKVLERSKQEEITERNFFSALIKSALDEGLPKSCLQFIFSKQADQEV